MAKNKVKNKYLFKRGGYAIAAIALVIAGAILLNVLVNVFADKYDLQYDLTQDKKHSVSAENEEFIKNVDKEVTVYVLAASEFDYHSSGYLQYYYSMQAISATNEEYYQQTTRLLNRYADLNDKINLVYLDPNGTQIGTILAKYSDEAFTYGDILVTCNFVSSSGKEISNYRHLTVHDIYGLDDPTGMASYGMGSYDVVASTLETSLTSALLSVTREDTKKIAFLNNKSKPEVFDYFRKILELNNFVVEDVDGRVPISSDYDVVVICAPSSDFSKEELDVLSIFLENGGKLGKTLLFYGESTNQNLPNFYNFLAEWGIGVESGIVVETSETLCLPDDRSTYISLGKTGAPFTVSQEFLSGFNIPMYERGEGEAYNGRTTTTFIGTNGTSAIVPIDTDISTLSVEGLERRALSTAIISTEEDYDNAAQESIFSHVIAFSSYDFISEYYIEGYKSLTNYTGATLNALKYATNMNDVSIVIEPKTLAETMEIYVVSESSAKNMKILFVGIIPVATLVVAFVIFFRRRNK